MILFLISAFCKDLDDYSLSSILIYVIIKYNNP